MKKKLTLTKKLQESKITTILILFETTLIIIKSLSSQQKIAAWTVFHQLKNWIWKIDKRNIFQKRIQVWDNINNKVNFEIGGVTKKIGDKVKVKVFFKKSSRKRFLSGGAVSRRRAGLKRCSAPNEWPSKRSLSGPLIYSKELPGPAMEGPLPQSSLSRKAVVTPLFVWMCAAHWIRSPFKQHTHADAVAAVTIPLWSIILCWREWLGDGIWFSHWCTFYPVYVCIDATERERSIIVVLVGNTIRLKCQRKVEGLVWWKPPIEVVPWEALTLWWSYLSQETGL